MWNLFYGSNDRGVIGRAPADRTSMKIDKNKRRTTFSRRDDGTVIAAVTQSWPRWQASISIPPRPPRYFAKRDAAERHAVYYAHRAAAQARGYHVEKTADGRFTFKRRDGALHDMPQITESDAWFAAYTDSTFLLHPTAG